MSELFILQAKLEREKKLRDIIKLKLGNLERAKQLNEDLDKLADKIKSEEIK